MLKTFVMSLSNFIRHRQHKLFFGCDCNTWGQDSRAIVSWADAILTWVQCISNLQLRSEILFIQIAKIIF